MGLERLKARTEHNDVTRQARQSLGEGTVGQNKRRTSNGQLLMDLPLPYRP